MCRAVSLALVATAFGLAALGPATARAQSEKGVLGVGIILGEPTGLSAKYYLADDRALDVAVGFAFVGRGPHVHADYLWHPWVLESKDSFVLPAYVGVGFRVLARDAGGGEEDHLRLGPRGVGGILFDFTRVPLDVFVEVAAVLDYRTKGDSTFGFGINAGAGVRYYF